MNKIFFNKPYNSKLIKKNVLNVLKNKVFADGKERLKTEFHLSKILKSKKIILTQSCTNALEASMFACGFKPGDEVILPSYTFTSTANCILMTGAKPVFADICKDTLNIDPNDVKKKINKNTKGIILVHYNGVPCDMQEFIKLKKRYKIFLIEDCAHSLTSKYKDKFLGTIGDIGTFSFHQTKNFPAGQGGALSVNNKKLLKKTIIYCDKGTNRSFKGKHKYYSWKGIGSEICATELTASLITSQLLEKNIIQTKRKKIWNFYLSKIKTLKQNLFFLQKVNLKQTTISYHIFPIIFYSLAKRLEFEKYMKIKSIECFFHYYPLHTSTFGRNINKVKLPNTEKIFDGLIRLPLYPDLKIYEMERVFKELKKFVELNN